MYCVCVCVFIYVCAPVLSCVWFFAIPWTVAHQSVHGIFQARILWSGLPFPTPGNLPAGRFFTTASPEKPLHVFMVLNHYVVLYFYSGQCDKVSLMCTVAHAAMAVHGALAVWAGWPQKALLVQHIFAEFPGALELWMWYLRVFAFLFYLCAMKHQHFSLPKDFSTFK